MTNKVNTRSIRKHNISETQEENSDTPRSTQTSSVDNITTERDNCDNSLLDLEQRLSRRMDKDRRNDQKQIAEMFARMEERILKSNENLARSSSAPNLTSSRQWNPALVEQASTSNTENIDPEIILPNESISIVQAHEVCHTFNWYTRGLHSENGP